MSPETKKTDNLNLLSDSTPCPKCGNTENHYMENYHFGFHEGDIHCGQCGAFVRRFDAG